MRGISMAEEANVSELIAELALRVLQASPYQEIRQLRCDVVDGKVTIRGQVTTFYAKQMAQTAVQKLDGVKSVVNEITVR